MLNAPLDTHHPSPVTHHPPYPHSPLATLPPRHPATPPPATEQNVGTVTHHYLHPSLTPAATRLLAAHIPPPVTGSRDAIGPVGAGRPGGCLQRNCETTQHAPHVDQ